MVGPESEERRNIVEARGGGEGSGKGKDLFVLTVIHAAALTCCPTGVDTCPLLIKRFYQTQYNSNMSFFIAFSKKKKKRRNLEKKRIKNKIE